MSACIFCPPVHYKLLQYSGQATHSFGPPLQEFPWYRLVPLLTCEFSLTRTLPYQMSRLSTPPASWSSRMWERFCPTLWQSVVPPIAICLTIPPMAPVVLGRPYKSSFILPPHPDICSRVVTNLSCSLRLCCAALNTSERVVGHALAVSSLTNRFSFASVKNSATCIWITSPSRWTASLYAILASPKILLVSSGRVSPPFCLTLIRAFAAFAALVQLPY